MTISINSSDVTRLKHLVTEGVRVKQEVEDLNEGLKETVKAVAEELEIKPKLLNKVQSCLTNPKVVQQQNNGFHGSRCQRWTRPAGDP